MAYQQYRPKKFQILPPVVKNLIIINILFYAATFVLRQRFHYDLDTLFGLHYFSSPHFRIYQFVTYMFMHGGLMHIGFNMFALWMFGYTLENYWGGKRFLIFYMICGIGAALIQQLFGAIHLHNLHEAIVTYSNSPTAVNFQALLTKQFAAFKGIPELQNFASAWLNQPHDSGMVAQSISYLNQLVALSRDIPTIGASGAIFGILLAFGMLFPNTLLYVYFAIPVKAKYFVIFYGLFELYFAIANNPGDNVAHFAHLGGMLFGFILIKYWQKSNKHFY